MERFKEFEFFRGKVRFLQPRNHRLSVVEILFVSNIRGLKKYSEVVDLGAGFGTLSILTSLKYGCRVWALERDPLMLELLHKNVKLNNLEDRIRVVDLDLRDIKKVFKPQRFDAVIANPPFHKVGLSNNVYHHETDTSLEDFVFSGSFLLKDGKGFNLLMSSNRLIEAVLLMKAYNINTAALRIFYPKASKSAKLVFIYGIKNLFPAPIIEKPLIINKEDGNYTEEVASILESFL